MESKWFIIIAMILSFLYKKYKERQISKEEIGPESENESSWGIEELFSKFEEQFESKPSTTGTKSAPNEVTNFSEDVYREKKSSTPLPETRYSEETSDHHAYFHRNEKVRGKQEEELIEDELPYDLDLEKMVVSQVILNRPEY